MVACCALYILPDSVQDFSASSLSLSRAIFVSSKISNYVIACCAYNVHYTHTIIKLDFVNIKVFLIIG